MNRTIRNLPLIGLMMLCTSSGCAKKTYPVQGQVVFKNDVPANELAGYAITFEIKNQNASASGAIKPDGTFTVGTFADGDGAPPGKHRVAITPPPPKIDEPRTPPLIAPKYGSFDTSELAVDVTAQTNKVTLKVERMK